jgi:hypothetical protein
MRSPSVNPSWHRLLTDDGIYSDLERQRGQQRERSGKQAEESDGS